MIASPELYAVLDLLAAERKAVAKRCVEIALAVTYERGTTGREWSDRLRSGIKAAIYHEFGIEEETP